ncbi:MAG: type IV toxin-antitoxin system AbiEi family antitoxin domain-containing protein [Lachnospiraceae bacterium]|nr:type IV toxin-antitoxin system AbiEi family antitoxin domain-containing protein [Lachnospiraceae bacterium]
MSKMTRREKDEYLLNTVKEKMAESGGILKTADITGLGIDYRRVVKWLDEGKIFRLKSGYYAASKEDKPEEDIVAGFFPDGVLTMDSALYAYGYLKEQPMEWHIAIDKNTSKSRFKMDFPLVRPYYTEEEVLKVGVTTTKINEATFKIYDKERLVCECLKYEDKLDRNILKDFLLEYIKDENKDIVRLLEYAKYRKVSAKVQTRIGVWL